MMKILMVALLCAVTFQMSNGADLVESKIASSLPSDLKVYQNKNILRNGDFKQKQFSVDLPLFWVPRHNYTIPEKRNLYSLTERVLTMREPFEIWQFNDITMETASEFVLSFRSKVESGSLLCNVSYRSYIEPNSLSSKLLSQKIPAGKDFEKHEYTFKLDPKYTSGFMQVIFTVSGKQGKIKLSDVSLRPIPPKSQANTRQIYIETSDSKVVLRGISLSDKHSFYELQAARYLQKYLFVGFGQYVDIFTADKAACEKEKGLILIGNAFIDNNTQAEVKTGGYAILTGNGNIRIAGKEDGAIQGAFAVLSNLGMDFYTLLDFCKPSSEVIKFTAKTVKNPAFGYRFITGCSSAHLVSGCALGESCLMLANNNRYLGYWTPSEHPLGTLIDPFLYFKNHPEYYALNKTLKCRTYKAVTGVTNSKTPEISYCMYMQICYSNPEVQKIVTENVLKYFETCPEMTICQLLSGDRYGPSNWCQCENCQKFGANDTDRWLKFINIVAREVKKKYPYKMIVTSSYAECKARPVNEKPEGNVIISYIVSQDGWACKNHFDCQKNRDAGWRKNVEDWLNDYRQTLKGVTLYGPSQPGGIFYPWAEKIKYFSQHGVNSFINAYIPGIHPLHCYVLSKLAWDPYQNIDELISKFTNFYYGPAAPYVKQYIDMLEKRDETRASKNPEPQLVDYDFMTKGEKLLSQAIVLTQDSRKKTNLERDRFNILQLYVSNNNKGTGLRGDRLQEFAKTFAEFLNLCKEFKIKKPVFNTSYRKFIQKVAFIDIGDIEPWYVSPVLQKILDDPVAMVANEEKAYVKTQYGLNFKMKLFCGGGLLMDQSAPSGSKRLFARVLRRASSPESSITCVFDLDKIPKNGAFIELEGINCEKADSANILVKINGKYVIHQKPSKFTKKDWTTMKIPLPAGILNIGSNSLTISNTTPDKIDEHVDETVGGTLERDYTWGWFMISNVQLHLPAE